MQVINLRNLIVNATIYSTDKLLWDNVISSKVTLSSIWHSIRDTGAAPRWLAAVWHRLAIPKCSFILWLAFRNRLFTRDRMALMGMQVDQRCVLCGFHQESTLHLFDSCNYVVCVLQDSVLSGQ